MRHLRLILTFYKSFFVLSFIVTLACLYIVQVHGLKALASLLGLKLLTFGLIYLYITSYKRRDFFYYQNLGMPKKKLWFSSLTLDIILFLVLMIITLIIK